MNKAKKVLILDNAPDDDLVFISVAGSDNLHYLLDETQYGKLKLTFLVSDIGQEEEIYGVANAKFKIVDISQNKFLKL